MFRKYTSGFYDHISPYLILFIFLYNPVYYLGTFDTVEEGLWAGWLQHLLQGQIMYRDFAVYHPPLLPAGLYLFSKFYGSSLSYIRLYFHLLSIFGFTVIYIFLTKIVKSTWIQITAFILIMAYGSSLVRNNVEIRLATGLIPIYFIYLFNISKNKLYLFLSGVLGVIALLVSVETGLASLFSVFIGTLFSTTKRDWLNRLLLTTIGVLTSLGIFLLFLLGTGSLNKFIEYVTYYPKLFSLGYQNILIERPELSNLVPWYLVDKFVKSSGALWEMSKLTLSGGLIYILLQKLRGKFIPQDVIFASLVAFGLVISRSALGRSDYYHITFVWIVCLMILSYFVDHIAKFSQTLSIVILTILILFIGRDVTQNSLLQNQLVKFQTYGTPPGTYPSYQNPRSKILTGIEVNTNETDNLVSFIDQNTGLGDSIFTFPHYPELYFLADRNNATSFDTPLVFITPDYQQQMINELIINKPKLIIYNPNFAVAGITVTTLSQIDQYINSNFKLINTIGSNSILKPTYE